LHIPDFIEAFPNFTLYTLLTTMALCVLLMLGGWLKTEWDISKNEDKVKTK